MMVSRNDIQAGEITSSEVQGIKDEQLLQKIINSRTLKQVQVVPHIGFSKWCKEREYNYFVEWK